MSVESRAWHNLEDRVAHLMQFKGNAVLVEPFRKMMDVAFEEAKKTPTEKSLAVGEKEVAHER